MSFGPETEILLRFVGELSPYRTLEVGCNYGKELKLLQPLTRVYGVDSNPEQIKKAKEFIKTGIFKVGHASDLPFSNNYFNLVYSDGCLSHNKENISKIIDEMLRVSKDYVLLIEYLGTKLSPNSYGNCKQNAWIHDYEKICATKKVIVCFSRQMPFGMDLFQVLLLKKLKRLVKEIVKIVPKKEQEILSLNFWKFNFKF